MNKTRQKMFEKAQKYINFNINMLTVEEIFYDEEGRGFKCRVKCDCGSFAAKRLSDIIRGRFISCGCHHRNRPNMVGQLNKAFKGIGKMTAVHFGRIKTSAEKRKIEFDLTKEYLWNLFQEQNECCALTGEHLIFGRVHFRHETTASLDRIDSNKGYVEGNVQWVSKVINLIKNKIHNDAFIELCSKVHNHKHKLQNQYQTKPSE